MGALWRRLWELGGGDAGAEPLTARPHLVFFLHDELIVHTPAAEAGYRLFAITVATVRSYDQAK
ncbi:hypothetical protein BH10ACT6_BH10ACT6_05580 [soil metagenome]